MTEANRFLWVVAERVAGACIAHARPRAILLTGSVAAGESDYHSDIDLITYYDTPPSEQQRGAVRAALGCEAPQYLGGTPDGESFGEEYIVRGVECQILCTTIGAWERRLADVLERFDIEMAGQKAIDGLLRGVPLHGADLIAGWQGRARAYPPGLARAMVEAHLGFFPIWFVQDWFAARDATLWYYQSLVESSQHLLGVLAGVNRIYFAPFQFKRAHRLIGELRVTPLDLAARLDSLFVADYTSAVADLERLVGETVTIVEAHLPEVDTSRVRQHLGARRQPWTPMPE